MYNDGGDQFFGTYEICRDEKHQVTLKSDILIPLFLDLVNHCTLGAETFSGLSSIYISRPPMDGGTPGGDWDPARSRVHG